MSASSTNARTWLRFNRRRLLRALLFLVGVWLVACCAMAIGVVVYGQTDRAQPADVIVVLGSGLNPDLTPGPALTRRSERAADLWKAGYASAIICSGGYTTSAIRSEAFGCGQVLRANGVPLDAIILEASSRSTEENAYYSHEIMQDHGWTTALVVSDAYHLLRATWIFSLQDYQFSTTPAVSPPPLDLVKAVAREVIALHWQAFKTIFHLPYTYVPYL